jgi:hypothetical protein
MPVLHKGKRCKGDSSKSWGSAVSRDSVLAAGLEKRTNPFLTHSEQDKDVFKTKD